MQIAGKTGVANQAVIRIRALRKSLDERAASAQDMTLLAMACPTLAKFKCMKLE
jgi:hypothetical protein